MLKPFKEWDRFSKVVSIATSVVALVAFFYAQLPWHATSVVIVCVAMAVILLFYPWRFPNWSKPTGAKAGDDFYSVMKRCWITGMVVTLLVGIGWSTTNLVWIKSPAVLAERIEEAYLEQNLTMTSAGIWEATISATNPPVPPILVGLPTLDKNRQPQTSDLRQCVPAVQALRAAFGELSTHSRDLRLIMVMAVLLVLGFAVIERLYEARVKADARIAANLSNKKQQ
jgi:hypothetical protein